MNKYLTIFKISLEQEFVYRLNFLMWRVRNIMQFAVMFFLWDSIFYDPKRIVFGYDRSKILAYVFGTLAVRAIVFSTRTIDIAGEIARGDLSNYLLRPISYIKYWFTREISSKTLNLVFAAGETLVLYFILKPEIYLPQNTQTLILFLLSLILAVFLYFFMVFFFGILPFWYPENAWGTFFLLFIFTDFFGGGIFPLDVLPQILQKSIYLTPFPYLIFIPLQIYLGKLSIISIYQAFFTCVIWIGIFLLSIRTLWARGLKVYRAEGR